MLCVMQVSGTLMVAKIYLFLYTVRQLNICQHTKYPFQYS